MVKFLVFGYDIVVLYLNLLKFQLLNGFFNKINLVKIFSRCYRGFFEVFIFEELLVIGGC